MHLVSADLPCLYGKSCKTRGRNTGYNCVHVPFSAKVFAHAFQHPSYGTILPGLRTIESPDSSTCIGFDRFSTHECQLKYNILIFTSCMQVRGWLSWLECNIPWSHQNKNLRHLHVIMTFYCIAGTRVIFSHGLIWHVYMYSMCFYMDGADHCWRSSCKNVKGQVFWLLMKPVHYIPYMSLASTWMVTIYSNYTEATPS